MPVVVSDLVLSEHRGIVILSELEPLALVTPEDHWSVAERLAEARQMTRPRVSIRDAAPGGLLPPGGQPASAEVVQP